MKRKVITSLIILICFLFQVPFFKLTFVRMSKSFDYCDCFFGIYERKREGMFVGFICGLLVDLFWGDALGFNMLIYTVIGYINGLFERLFYEDDIKLPIGLIAASELVYGMVTYICMYMLQGDFAFGSHLTRSFFRNLYIQSWSLWYCIRSSYTSTSSWKQKNKGVQANLYSLWERTDPASKKS